MAKLYRRSGGEFLVNSTTEGSQGASRLVPLADGGFVAFWVSADAALLGIRGQRFDSAGAKVGAEFAVNSTTAGNQQFPNAVALSSGAVMVGWWDESNADGDSSAGDYRGQIYDSSGAPSGSELHLASVPAPAVDPVRGIPALGALPGGGFVVAWTQDDPGLPDESGSSIKAQRFDSAGVKVGDPIAVNTATAGPQYHPALAVLSSGEFVVTWSELSSTFETSGNAIIGQRFDVSGNKLGAAFLVNTVTASHQLASNVTALASGGFIVTWNDGDPQQLLRSVKAQIYDSAGARVGGEMTIAGGQGFDTISGRVAPLPDGGFLATWFTANGRDALAQFFDSAGNPVGQQFTLSEVTTGTQSATQPIVLSDGTIVAAWTDNSGIGGDSSGSGIKARLFTADAPAPSDIALSTSQVSETAFSNSVAATLSSAGALNDNFTYSLVSDSTGGGFRIEGDKLVVADNNRLDFESARTATVEIMTTDRNGRSFSETITIDLTDTALEQRFAENPTFTAASSDSGYQYETQTVALSGGGFALIWFETQPGPPSTDRTLARFYDSNGACSRPISLTG